MSEPQQSHGPEAPGLQRVAPENPACGVTALARRLTTVRRAAPCRPGFRAATRLASPIGTALGPIGLSILNRLFGLILTAIAVEIMANGLRQLFPVLAG